MMATLVSQPAFAFVGGWGQPARSAYSSSRLCVLTNPLQESTSVPSEDENNELFSLVEDIESDTLYQVQKASDKPPQELSNELPQPFPELTKDEEEDLKYFNRDQDDMLTEREDRMYISDKGIRRKVERCILVGVEDLSVQRKGRRAELYFDPLAESSEADAPCFTLDESMTEMKELIRTAGLDLCGEMTQRLQEVNPKTYVGTGKIKEVQELMEQMGACTIIFDAELTPGQQKHLENAFNQKLMQDDFNFKANTEEGEIKVLDRTALILDIFAQHAKTREGKLQVDLALHEYRKPRLTKMWTHLERQSGAGGVGLRGPGESQVSINGDLGHCYLTGLNILCSSSLSTVGN
jgi:hypothetical protein